MVDTTLVLAAMIAATPPTLAAMAGLVTAMRAKAAADTAVLKADQTHDAVELVHQTVNSRMTELLAATKEASRAEGVVVGKAGGNGG